MPSRTLKTSDPTTKNSGRATRRTRSGEKGAVGEPVGGRSGARPRSDGHSTRGFRAAISDEVSATNRKRSPNRTRAELKGSLLLAATRLFSDRGYQSVSIREITREAGVALPVLYWFFRSKRALYVECYLSLGKQSIESLSQSLEGLTDPLDIVYAFTLMLCEQNIRSR